MKSTLLLVTLTLGLLGCSSAMANLTCPKADDFKIRQNAYISGNKKIGNIYINWVGALPSGNRERAKVISVSPIEEKFFCLVKVRTEKGEDYDIKTHIDTIQGLAPRASDLSSHMPEIMGAFERNKDFHISLNGYKWRAFRLGGHLDRGIPILAIDIRDPQAMYERLDLTSGFVTYGYRVTNTRGQHMQMALTALIDPNKFE